MTRRSLGLTDLTPSTPAVFLPWLSCVTRRTASRRAASDFIIRRCKLWTARTSPRREARKMRFCRWYTVFSSLRQGTDDQSSIGRSSVVDRPSLPFPPTTRAPSVHMTVPASAYRGHYPTRLLLGQSLPTRACGLVACSPSHGTARAPRGVSSVPTLRLSLPLGPHYLPGAF